jgi:hypothetical protein
MILVLALRSLLARPIRSVVLAGGFGLGVAVMAALLGIGGVILEQARTPDLAGGGDVVLAGAAGRLGSARFILANVLGSGTLAERVHAAAPSARATLYLVDERGSVPIQVRAGIPGRERALGDPETGQATAWADTAADSAWAAPDASNVLRAMDGFHPIPDVPARAASWAEWLYFNGRAGDVRFYLTFIAGPRLDSGRRALGVRLQLERRGDMTSYSQSLEVDEAALRSAPDLDVGESSVRLDGLDYRIRLNLTPEAGGPGVTGTIVLRATPGRSLPPFVMRGANGWMSGYVVPVMEGALSGEIRVGNDTLDLSDGTGYHDHNWGFWEGVRWQWGQVQGEGLSFVYGRVYPPADAADADRLPGFVIALGPQGPVGFATEVTIEETDRETIGRPARIVIRGRSDSLQLTLDLAIENTTSTRMRQGFFGGGMQFLQMRARYRVSGRAGDRDVDFTASGSAETFRGEKTVAPTSPRSRKRDRASE